MACDTASLIAQAQCLSCYLTGDLLVAGQIVLLCEIRDGTPVNCDPQALAAQAQCIRNCIPAGMLDLVKLSLLCGVSDAVAALVNARITQAGDTRITQDGNTRVIQ